MDFDYFAQHKSEIFAVWHGGMSIHGGIIGGILSGLIISKLNKIPFLKYADIFSYGLIIGQAIGRFGNYFNCEAFGKPCYIPYLKLYIPEQYRPYGYEQFSYFHPTFLYESIWNIIVFFLLFFVIRKLVQIKNLKEGTIFFSYLILYSTGRFFIEWCRLDSIKNIYGLHIAQVVSIATIIIATICLLYRNKVRA
jgi:phosphatidylglycerol:prolipoprotein diacylglycerol transferase